MKNRLFDRIYLSDTIENEKDLAPLSNLKVANRQCYEM